MNKPHKHQALIKAWADGAQVQIKNIHGEWVDCVATPVWIPDLEYRVKPVPLPFQDVLDAYVAGKCIQVQSPYTGIWHTWDPVRAKELGNFDGLKSLEHGVVHHKWVLRIKPEQVVKQCRAQLSDVSGDLGLYTISHERMNLRLTFEDGKLVKAEVIG